MCEKGRNFTSRWFSQRKSDFSESRFVFITEKILEKKLGAVGLCPVLRNRVSRGAFGRLKTIRDFEEEKNIYIII